MRCAKCGRFVSSSKPCLTCYQGGEVREVRVDIRDFSGDGFYYGLDDAPLWLRILRFLKRIICWRGED